MPNLDDARALLTTRYGPLPGYAWLGIAAGGTYLVVRHRRAAGAPSSSTDAAAGDTSTSTSAPVDEAATGYANDYIPPGAPSGAPAPPVANPAPSAPPPVRRRPPGPLGHTSRHHVPYTVKRGDTIGGIARQFHTTTAAIERANPAIHKTRTGRISVGEVLVIP